MDSYIYAGLRTARGLGKAKGALAGIPPVELLATCFRALASRLPNAAAATEDVVLGCVTQASEQGANLGKIAALYAGFGEGSSGVTVNRFCASGLAAIGDAAARVASGTEQIVAAAGVESMSRVPMLTDGGAWFQNPAVAVGTGFVHMGIAADAVATQAGLSRDDLDGYALTSHARALHAAREGHFDKRIVHVSLAGGTSHATDEGPREGLTREKLAAFAPAFGEELAARFDPVVLARYPELGAVRHLHTVATSPAIADAASLLLVGSRGAERTLGTAPEARIRAVANVGSCPVLMLGGNVPAVKKAVEKAGLSLADIDLFEINESFAAVPLSFARALSISHDRLNVSGGAIALGHPLGATGGILLLTLLDDLARTGGRYGVASICAGAGIAAAIVIERLVPPS